MSTPAPDRSGVVLRQYAAVLTRRKWTALVMVIAVPIAALVFSLGERKLYQASAQVLLSAQNLAQQLTQTQSSGIVLQPDRVAQTQADLARVDTVAAAALQRVPAARMTVPQFLQNSSVSTTANADLLTFSVTTDSPSLSRRLVDAYAAAYTSYRREIDTSAIQKALAGVTARLSELKGARRGSLYGTLVNRQQTLQTMEALQTSNAAVVQEAAGVVRTQPQTGRNVAVGLVLGLMLGVGFAFARDAMDPTVRNPAEVLQDLGNPAVLAHLPPPPKHLRAQRKVVMIEEPAAAATEGFRMLRANLAFTMLDRNVRSVMVTSGVAQEGKSTTASNLAVALARGGQHVVLADLDLRRPAINSFFGLEGPGITDVALGTRTLEEALVRVPLSSQQEAASFGRERPFSPSGGVLEVLTTGPLPPEPGEFVATRVLGDILGELRDRGDVLLVDTPPLLQVGDATTLSSRVDALLLVARLDVLRRPTLNALGRHLKTLPIPMLGVILTGASAPAMYGYSYEYGDANARAANGAFEYSDRQTV